MPSACRSSLFVIPRFVRGICPLGSGSLLLLLPCRLESAETERHRGLDEPTSPFTSRAARNVGGQCSSCRFASPPPARGPRTFPFPHTSPHRSSNRPPPPLRPAAFRLSRHPFSCHSERSEESALRHARPDRASGAFKGSDRFICNCFKYYGQIILKYFAEFIDRRLPFAPSSCLPSTGS